MSSPARPFTRPRYQRIELLGSGGLCEIHRAFDETRGQEVALKQLLQTHRDCEASGAQSLIETEYLTLKQVQHPSIIEVYDYGVEDEYGPYYTMELLSGTDLQALAPLVCSAWSRASGSDPCSPAPVTRAPNPTAPNPNARSPFRSLRHSYERQPNTTRSWSPLTIWTAPMNPRWHCSPMWRRSSEASAWRSSRAPRRLRFNGPAWHCACSSMRHAHCGWSRLRPNTRVPSAVEERLAHLSQDARRLVGFLALDCDAQLRPSDYGMALGPDSAARVHEALAELSRARLLLRADDGYRFHRGSDQAGIADGMPEGVRQGLHLILAECMRRNRAEPIYEAYHFVQAGHPDSAHDAMQKQMAIEVAQPTRARKPIELDTVERMVEFGAREGWPLPMLTQYRTFCCGLAAVSGAYERVKPLAEVTLRALARYGGLTDYEELSELPSDQRLQQALARAQARFAELPADQLPMAPAAALGALTRVGALAATCGYLMAEPELFSVIPSLAPLSPLSPAFGFADRLIGAFRSLSHGQLWAG